MSMEAYREVLQDKLRPFHQNYGTADCFFALDERKRSCVTLGLLKNEQKRLVTSLFQVLPTEDDLGESFRSDGHGNGSTTCKESVDAAPSITHTFLHNAIATLADVQYSPFQVSPTSHYQ